MERKVIPISNYREFTATDVKQLNQRLRFFTGPLAGTTVDLTGDTTVLGKSAQANLAVADSWVEDLHCAILCDEGGVQLVDLNSNSGTYLNGRKVNRARLQTQDRVRLGKTHFEFQVFDSTDVNAKIVTTSVLLRRPHLDRKLSFISVTAALVFMMLFFMAYLRNTETFGSKRKVRISDKAFSEVNLRLDEMAEEFPYLRSYRYNPPK